MVGDAGFNLVMIQVFCWLKHVKTKTTGIRKTNPTGSQRGSSLQNRLQHLASKRTALVLGDAAACLAGLRALKFQRIVATVACESVEVLQDLKKALHMVV